MKNQQDGTILAIELNDLKMTFSVIKNVYQILIMKMIWNK